jgi:hypothetical protein
MPASDDKEVSPRFEDEVAAEMRVVALIYKAAFVATIVLTILTAAVGYLAVESASQSECANGPWLQGYRPVDFFALSLVDAFIVFMFIFPWFITGLRKRLGEQEQPPELSAEEHAVIVFQFGSIRITNGIHVAFMVFVGLAGICGLMLGIAFTHYQTILSDCRFAIAPH